uniref:Uncharacterized protein n=1 Tax=Oryza brachyantha TaxID=4533 RepID=J3KU62_ORYBR
MARPSGRYSRVGLRALAGPSWLEYRTVRRKIAGANRTRNHKNKDTRDLSRSSDLSILLSVEALLLQSARRSGAAPELIICIDRLKLIASQDGLRAGYVLDSTSRHRHQLYPARSNDQMTMWPMQ